MKSRMELRLECLRLAATLGASKNIPPKEVVPYAMEFFKWIDDNPEDETDTEQLASRFRVAVHSP